MTSVARGWGEVVITAGISVVLHLTLGWMWTLLAGLAGGFIARRRGWLVGLSGVGFGWLVLVGYNFAVAPGPTARMVHTVGSIFGNLPGAAVVGLTLLIGLALGAVGGLAGATLARLAHEVHTASARTRETTPR